MFTKQTSWLLINALLSFYRVRLHNNATMNWFNTHKLLTIGLVVTIVFLFWSRLFLLHIIPSTLPHDELVYAVQAASYVLQGTTIDQLHYWWELTPFDPMFAELPATLMSLGFLFTKNALLGSHLTSVLMGISLPFFLAWLIYRLCSQKDVATSLFVLAVFNPLLWQFSRFGYDAFYSLWFYVVGAIFLTQRKSKMIWWSIPFFTIGFFNYQGMKLLLVPWVSFVISLQRSHHLTKKQLPNSRAKWLKLLSQSCYQLAVLSAAIILTMFYGLVMLPAQTEVSERLNSTIFSDTTQLANNVNHQRLLTISNPLSRAFNNKFVEAFNHILSRMISAFNPFMLFMIVEPSVSGFSVWIHGIFYWVEGILIGLGSFLLLKRPSTRIFGSILILGVFILCIPTWITTNSEWHLLRTMLSYVTLLIIAAWGFNWVMHHQRLKWIFLTVYSISILQFTYIYFFRFPIISLDWGNFSERQTAHYLTLFNRSYPNTPIAVHVTQSDYYFWAYLLYSGELNRHNLEEISATVHNSIANNDRIYKYKNIIFTPNCYNPQSTEPQLVENSVLPCPEYTSHDSENTFIEKNPQKILSSFVQVKDSGLKLKIYHDLLCQNHQLNSFVHLTNYSQLEIERMDQAEFCQTWVTSQFNDQLE